MYDTGKIVTGLFIFLLLVTFPFWYGKGNWVAPPSLSLDTPEIRKMASARCVEPTPYMRAHHMELLDTWREAVVREGDSLYVNDKGERFPMSLSEGCLFCHSNRERFCDACHSYSGTRPRCWSCHVVAERDAR